MFDVLVPVIIHHNSFGPGSNLGLETLKNPSRPRRKGSFFAPVVGSFVLIKIRNPKPEIRMTRKIAVSPSDLNIRISLGFRTSDLGLLHTFSLYSEKNRRNYCLNDMEVRCASSR